VAKREAYTVPCVAGSADEVDHTAVGAAITTITTNLPEMTRGVRMIAALMEDESSGDKLLDAARKLCSAFSDLLKAAEPETKEVSLMWHVLNHYLLTPWSRVLLEKLTSKLCS